MYTVLVVIQVLVAIALIGLVLVQHGKGADAGAAFGSGASGTVFGARGAANFLSRSTAWLAFLFFAISLALAYMVSNRGQPESLVDRLATEVPAAPAGPVVPDESAHARPDAPAVVPGDALAQPAAEPAIPD